MTIIASIFENIKKYPDRKAIIAEDAVITYRELGEYISLFASYLKQNGLEKEDRVVFQGVQNSAFTVICLGTLLAGGVSVPVEKNILRQNLDGIVRDTKAVFVFTRDDLPDFSLKGILGLCEGVSRVELPLPQPDDMSDIIFTTGTTGTSEGVVHTHGSQYAAIENALGFIKMPADNTEMIVPVLSHVYGLRRFYSNMVNGSTVVILEDLLPISRFFDMLEKHYVTSMTMNPSLLVMILKTTGRRIAGYADQLKYMVFSSAPLKKDCLIETIKLLPRTKIYNLYGSTEAGSTSGLDNVPHLDKEGCIGKPNCRSEYFLIDGDNFVTGTGPECTGFLAIKGPMVMKEYWGKPEKTEKVLKDGLYITQDVMYRDEEGFYYFMGRASDIISVGGFKVAPDEVEDAARKYAGINDCACVGKSDPLAGEVPVLFIVPHESHNEAEFIKHLKNNLENYKLPRQTIMVDEIPRTFNGKILRRKLKETFLKHS